MIHGCLRILIGNQSTYVHDESHDMALVTEDEKILKSHYNRRNKLWVAVYDDTTAAVFLSKNGSLIFISEIYLNSKMINSITKLNEIRYVEINNLEYNEKKYFSFHLKKITNFLENLSNEFYNEYIEEIEYICESIEKNE